MRTASFSLLTILCLMLAVDPAMADTLYDNGPYNGTTDAWAIDYGSAVSDSFTVLFDSEITGFHMVYWTAAGNVLTSVDMAFGATSFGGFYNAYGRLEQHFPDNQPVWFCPLSGRPPFYQLSSMVGPWLCKPPECLHHRRLL